MPLKTSLSILLAVSISVSSCDRSTTAAEASSYTRTTIDLTVIANALQSEGFIRGRNDFTSIEELYLEYTGRESLDRFDADGWSYSEGNKAFDFLVHAKGSELPSMSVLIATPCVVKTPSGKFVRIVLTHSLTVENWDESRYREQVIKQLQYSN